METSYTRPPIVEAILDIRVEAPVDLTPSHLAMCHQRLRNDYPVKRALRLTHAQLSVADDAFGAAGQSIDVGYAFVSADGKRVFQARVDGCTVNRLKPYPGWELFRSEAKKVWSNYQEVAKPGRIVRVALRFINRIDLPGPSPELKHYFRTLPEIGPGLPQSISTFFMQLTLPLPAAQATLNLVQTSTDAPAADKVSVVLDLDLYRTEDLPPDEDDLWQIVECLREEKNKAFRACITDQAEELFR